MSTITPSQPVPQRMDAPRVLEVLGNRLELLVESDRCTSFSMVRYTVAPGFTAPPMLHHHISDDVAMHVTAGCLVMVGVEGEIEVRAGHTVLLPHGTPFAWRNASAEEPAQFLAVYSPSGFEQYFVEVAGLIKETGTLDPQRILPLWERYGLAVSEVG